MVGLKGIKIKHNHLYISRRTPQILNVKLSINKARTEFMHLILMLLSLILVYQYLLTSMQYSELPRYLRARG